MNASGGSIFIKKMLKIMYLQQRSRCPKGHMRLRDCLTASDKKLDITPTASHVYPDLIPRGALA
jgi:hypothetical protein